LVLPRGEEVPAIKVVSPAPNELVQADAIQRAQDVLGRIGVRPPMARKSLVEEDTVRGSRSWVVVWYSNVVSPSSGQALPFAKVEVDSKTGELMHVSVLDPARSGLVGDSASALQEAGRLASQLSLPAGFNVSSQFTVPVGSETMWVVRWRAATENGVLRDDFVEMDFTQKGWLGYHKNIRPLPTDMTVILTRDNAVERAVAQLQKIGAQLAPQLLNATTRIVQPNYYFTPGGPFKVSGSSYVAWVCEFAVGHNSRVVVWVDAQTGEILGGDRTL
jgi:hypothetical protein